MTKCKWRDALSIHPAAELLPLMSPEELRELAHDINKHGLLHKIDLYEDNETGIQYVLDGRNRLDAMELLGWDLLTVNGKLARIYQGVNINYDGEDLVAWVIAKNIRRRHLNHEQKRELLAELLKLDPGKSNRQIAEAASVDHKTVAAVRAEAEGRGEIPHVETITDTQGREQPVKKCTVISKDGKRHKMAEKKTPQATLGRSCDEPEFPGEPEKGMSDSQVALFQIRDCTATAADRATIARTEMAKASSEDITDKVTTAARITFRLWHGVASDLKRTRERKPTAPPSASPLHQQINDMTRGLDTFISDWTMGAVAFLNQHPALEEENRTTLFHRVAARAEQLHYWATRLPALNRHIGRVTDDESGEVTPQGANGDV